MQVVETSHDNLSGFLLSSVVAAQSEKQSFLGACSKMDEPGILKLVDDLKFAHDFTNNATEAARQRVARHFTQSLKAEQCRHV